MLIAACQARENDSGLPDPTPVTYLDVHGGITFSGAVSWDHEGGWWFGFDTGHHRDGPEHNNAIYVRAETESLALQLAALGGAK
jgi:hypothetical protein